MNKERGFSLVELSITLVIIATITAGYLSGDYLVEKARLQKFISELTETQIAYDSFKEQFKQVPGDMKDAHKYWGAECDASANKCNGNGNGLISWNGEGDSGSTNMTDDNETFRTWQHMHLGGFIFPPFTGISGGGTENADHNALYHSDTKIGKYFIINRRPWGGIFGQYDLENLVVLGNAEPGRNIWYKTLTIAQTYGIDKKMDNGIANSGKIFGASGYGTASENCSENFLHATGSNYNFANLDVHTPHCIILFHLLN